MWREVDSQIYNNMASKSKTVNGVVEADVACPKVKSVHFTNCLKVGVTSALEFFVRRLNSRVRLCPLLSSAAAVDVPAPPPGGLALRLLPQGVVEGPQRIRAGKWPESGEELLH